MKLRCLRNPHSKPLISSSGTRMNLPFGGEVVVLGGDFLQVLPVMETGGADEQIANCIKKSYLWNQFRVFHLKTNMRLTGGALQWNN
ncbi:hypothetical protein B9Z55_025262 [Caenorhabditis nigoni]|uniref:ATP-dependent DNA helicase n=1 Tax=Caenorhabditis nigoni TaxID=1611254 RepID=A0A2G5SY32_9PELO|nr:hypothetical protein B9Z55_025262 [Caenorhabditis nigoni]